MTSLPSVKSRPSQPVTPARAPPAGYVSLSGIRSLPSSSARRRPTITARADTRRRLSCRTRSPRPTSTRSAPSATHRNRAGAGPRPARASRATTAPRRASSSAARISPSMWRDSRRAAHRTRKTGRSEGEMDEQPVGDRGPRCHQPGRRTDGVPDDHRRGAEAAASIVGQLRVAANAGEPLNPEIMRWFEKHVGFPVHGQ
jgi:hypothetical protein